MRRFVYIPISQNANSSAGSGGRRQTYKPMFCRTAPYASNVFIIENFHTSSITKYCYTGNHLPSFTPNTTEWLFFFFFCIFSHFDYVFESDTSSFPLCKFINCFIFQKKYFKSIQKISGYLYHTGFFFHLSSPVLFSNFEWSQMNFNNILSCFPVKLWYTSFKIIDTSKAYLYQL